MAGSKIRDRGDEAEGRPRETAARAPDGGAGTAFLQGVVEVVSFHAPETRYTVLKLSPERGYRDPAAPDLIPSQRLTAVGHLDPPSVGLRVRLSGSWRQHPSHGRQFAIDVLEVLLPLDERGLVRYLSSKIFKGLGETLARRIVKKLGAGALTRIREDPGCLEGVRGLRPQVAAGLAATLAQELDAHRARAFLRGLGLGPAQADRVLEELGLACEEVLRGDPYLLARRVRGIGFATADQIAGELGFATDSIERCRAALHFALCTAADDGHSLLEAGELFEAAQELMRAEVEEQRLREALLTLERTETLVRELAPGEGEGLVERVYLPWLATSERGLAKNLLHLLDAGPVPPLALPPDLARAEAASDLALHPLQREAVLGLLSHPLALLTGGPGVGKTTIVRLVAELAERAGKTLLLASPTGRAAKRLSEAAGRSAATIHRMLGYEPRTGGFAHGEQLPLEADLVVVDEISMLDLVLAHHLLKAVQPPTRLLLVGDPDQLPSVGPGNVLGDLLASARVPTWRLTEVFRQQEGGLIVGNAHRILRGEMPHLPDRGDRESEFYFFPAADPEEAAERLVEVVTQRIPETFGLDWMRDVQVLAPMYRGPCGVDALNRDLREALGLGGREVRRGSRCWRTGDRVIHTRNDYERAIFNGDLGRIVEVGADGKVLVRFPEQDVTYGPEQLSDLQPAFAITVHRSQGGEYPAVVMPMVPQHHVMLQRNLLYTAVTRASRLVVLVGSRRALQRAVDNAEQSRRKSALAERLRGEARTD